MLRDENLEIRKCPGMDDKGICPAGGWGGGGGRAMLELLMQYNPSSFIIRYHVRRGTGV